MLSFIIAVVFDQVVCFKKHQGSWSLNPINGEEWSKQNVVGLNVISDLVNQQSNYQQFKNSEIYVLFNSADEQDGGNGYRYQLISEMGRQRYNHVQMMDIANLLHKLSSLLITEQTLCSVKFWEQYLLPLFDSTYIASNAAVTISMTSDTGNNEHLALIQNYESKCLENNELKEKYEILNLELLQLTKKITQQKEQINEMAMRGDAIPITDLVRYLPLFYRHFWERVSPEEFASVIGISQPPTDIQSIEPTEKVRVILRQQFLALPENKKNYILKTVDNFRVILGDVRPELTSVVGGNK